jgi:phage-related minor tail protein
MPAPTEPTVTVLVDSEPMRQALEETARLGDAFAARLSNAFVQIAVEGKSLEDVVRSLGMSLSKIALQSALKPLQNGLSSMLQNLIAGAMGGGGGGGVPTPFAHGGVIASPISFPLGSGTGVAGERGAEAIMPLARGPDGRLGVAMSGGGGRGATITLNISTPNAESFRQSETQIGALLARTMSRGQRNM